MPFYDYSCVKCNHVFEVRHGMSEEPVIICEKCKYTCKKMIGSNIVQGSSLSTEISDYGDIRDHNPKYLRLKSGERVRYDSTKHGFKKGSGR